MTSTVPAFKNYPGRLAVRIKKRSDLSATLLTALGLPADDMVSALASLLMPLAVTALSLSTPQLPSASGLVSSSACSPASRASLLRCQEEAAVQKPQAFIEFIQGVPEPVVPDVKLTRSVDGSTGVATFTFDNPSFLAASSQELGETTGQLTCAASTAEHAMHIPLERTRSPTPGACNLRSGLSVAGMYLNDDEGVIKTNEVSLALSLHSRAPGLEGLLISCCT